MSATRGARSGGGGGDRVFFKRPVSRIKSINLAALSHKQSFRYFRIDIDHDRPTHRLLVVNLARIKIQHLSRDRSLFFTRSRSPFPPFPFPRSSHGGHEGQVGGQLLQLLQYKKGETHGWRGIGVFALSLSRAPACADGGGGGGESSAPNPNRRFVRLPPPRSPPIANQRQP